MLHANYIERETVLAVCPEARCRRTHACMAARADCPHPCLRTHEDIDTVRMQLADTLDALRLEITGGAARKPRSGLALELSLKYFKELLQEADSANTARALAPGAASDDAASQRRRRAQR